VRRRLSALLLGSALLAGAGCGGGPGAAPPPVVGEAALRLLPLGSAVPATGGPVAWVEVAADPDAWARGLMDRTVLPEDTGMLFAYPTDAPRSFWMKNCALPLSAAFLDASGTILNIREMAPGAGVPDDRLPFYDSLGPARYVLEMEAGWFAARGIRPGDRVDLAAALQGWVPR